VSGSLYEEQLRPLASRYKLVFWDYVGCGRSQSSSRQFSLNEDLQDLKAVISSIKEPVILMGHSYGGLLAINCASEKSSIVKGLVLVNSMPSFSHAKKSMQKKMERLSQLNLEEEYFELGEKVFMGQASEADVENFWSIESKLQVRDDHHAIDVSKKLQPSFAVVTGIQEDLAAIDYSQELKNLKIPILITAGTFDIIALDRPREMHAMLPLSTIHEYKKSGHFPFLEENELFISQTLQWLKNLSL